MLCKSATPSFQTWEKFESLQHLPLLAEIHHQVTHVVTGFSLQGEAKGWSHCDAAEKETHKKHTKKWGGNKCGSIIELNQRATKKKQVILVLLTKKRPLTTFLTY